MTFTTHKPLLAESGLIFWLNFSPTNYAVCLKMYSNPSSTPSYFHSPLLYINISSFPPALIDAKGQKTLVRNVAIQILVAILEHKAILINCDSEPSQSQYGKRVIKLYDIRQPHIDNLNQAICTYNWSHLTIDRDIDSVYNWYHLTIDRDIDSVYNWYHFTIDRDIDSVYNAFKIVIEWHINLFVPQKQVTLSSNNPEFVMPLIKLLYASVVS